ncbi:TIGR01440 family protein [Bacillus sp. FJAT-47783]|uniref:TIGR01440 family protein n=1 Tax=Bacillus sp. FJAT-47783 TaxID=2922712 RepID=UPI001FAD2588|nr:TIGR01440 family protein [Bacillus sp. FJAT-47783]
MSHLQDWKEELSSILQEFKQQVSFRQGQLFVIGCSTSEVIGERIGTAGANTIAEMIYNELFQFHKETGVDLAFQCCEHLNRALVIEREVAEKNKFELVSVVPVPKAGGSMAAYAFEQMKDPVVVEFIKADAGMDIGDTLIGMHLKHVAVPVRCSRNTIGHAHVTLATTRPKLIGGARAQYEQTKKEESCT